MAKLGYYGGNPENILNAPLDMVLYIMQYEAFEIDYVDELRELSA